ncbi:dihydrofolate reductase family protein [Pseudonocardia sp. TRM90224]|uniref:dihydrofolate reductase family protein n=1 Tax=Pseudonocardia sp. TRM90224 TaxID=2812678 RepID=UPI001E5FA5C0|nr:dihydrofolate reductase family protein [Pseudonocardia sp. TRM90224]
MSKIVYLDMSMSVDGFVAGPGVSAESGLGAGGERLHEWLFVDPAPESSALLDQTMKRIGSMMTGRRTYDISQWGPDGPAGELRLPVFVLTNRGVPGPEAGSVYTFVTSGVDELVERAKAAAGEKDIAVSGADVGQQLLRAGYVDELVVHVVPELFGEGLRLYDQVGAHIGLEIIETIPTSRVTHQRYRVLNRKAG